jgi:hypothetical protein
MKIRTREDMTRHEAKSQSLMRHFANVPKKK